MLRLTRISIFSIALFSFVLIVADAASAQLRLPRPSQKASVMQTIGVTDVTITYHRPGVKGRKIYGDWPADAVVQGVDASRMAAKKLLCCHRPHTGEGSPHARPSIARRP